MKAVYAPAAVLLAAGAASGQVFKAGGARGGLWNDVAAAPIVLPAAAFQHASQAGRFPTAYGGGISSPYGSVTLPRARPSLAPTVLGVPGPGVRPEHVEAVKALADSTGLAWFMHGGRQTGEPFDPAAELDLGVVGSHEAVLHGMAARWDGVSDAKHGPTASVPTVEEAVGRGHLVVAPGEPRTPGELGALRRLAAPWRTAAQLARLQREPRVPGERFRFAVIGDAEPGRFWLGRVLFNRPGVFWKLLARADRAGGDFIIQLGDLVSRGLVRNFWAFFRGMASAGPRTPFLTVIGNHDRHAPHGASNDRVYRAAFGETNYAFERAGWRFVVVDTSAGRLTTSQIEWLKSALDGARRSVVFTHIPPAPLGEWTDFGRFKGIGGFKTGAEEFMSLMSEREVARVYVGHVHGLGTLERGGVTYVLSGGGGSPLFPGFAKRRLHHWLSVEAGPEGLVETVHAADGKSFPLR